MKRTSRTQRLTLTSLFLAIGIVLPFISAHALGLAGTVLLPMHIPALLCGFLCGPLYGAVCGALLPVLNCLLTGMPSLFPMMPIMCAELCTYGLVSGLMLCKTPLGRKKWGVYPSLLCALICGRIAYALMFVLLFAINGTLKAPTVLTAVIVGIPGIVVQVLLVPSIVFAVCGFDKRKNSYALESAENLIDTDKATCVVIADGKILTTEKASGIKPILSLYDSGLLNGTTVVDKVVGRAAALVMVAGGVRACYARVVSRGALEVFKSNGIFVEYTDSPEHIINRTGDGICPMEAATAGIDEPLAAICAIRAKLEQLSGK